MHLLDQEQQRFQIINAIEGVVVEKAAWHSFKGTWGLSSLVLLCEVVVNHACHLGHLDQGGIPSLIIGALYKRLQ